VRAFVTPKNATPRGKTTSTSARSSTRSRTDSRSFFPESENDDEDFVNINNNNINNDTALADSEIDYALDLEANLKYWVVFALSHAFHTFLMLVPLFGKYYSPLVDTMTPELRMFFFIWLQVPEMNSTNIVYEQVSIYR